MRRVVGHAAAAHVHVRMVHAALYDIRIEAKRVVSLTVRILLVSENIYRHLVTGNLLARAIRASAYSHPLWS